MAFFPLPGTPGSAVPPEGGEGCVLANGASAARLLLYISASEVSLTLHPRSVLTGGWNGLGLVFMGELWMLLQLLKSLVSSSTPGDMVGGGGFFRSESPRIYFTCCRQGTQNRVLVACTQDPFEKLHGLVETEELPFMEAHLVPRIRALETLRVERALAPCTKVSLRV